MVLLLVVIDLAFGGVLIQGLCGIVKFICVWGLVELLFQGEFVELLLGVSEEQLIGFLNIEMVLKYNEV